MKDRKPQTGIEALSEREREVLILASKGFTNREIADLLDLSYHTICEHTLRLHIKLEVSTKVEAAVIAAKAGLV